LAAMWLQKLDNELQQIKTALESRFPGLDLQSVLPIKERIIKQYGCDVKDTSTLKSVFRTNVGYGGCVTPAQEVEGGFIPSVNSRLFWEDIPYGLCILKGVAEMMDMKTPSIDFMIEWHQQWMGKEYVKDGKLVKETMNETAPAAYGITSIEQLVSFSL